MKNKKVLNLSQESIENFSGYWEVSILENSISKAVATLIHITLSWNRKLQNINCLVASFLVFVLFSSVFDLFENRNCLAASLLDMHTFFKWLYYRVRPFSRKTFGKYDFFKSFTPLRRKIFPLPPYDEFFKSSTPYDEFFYRIFFQNALFQL